MANNIEIENQRRSCSKKTSKLEHFTKYVFAAHKSISEATSHDMQYNFERSPSNVSCVACLLPFKLIHAIKNHSTEDMHVLSDNCGEKFKFQMAHSLGVKNQGNE